MNLYIALGIVLAAIIIVFLSFRMKMLPTFIIFLTLILLLRAGVFMITEGSQAVITQFGKIVGTAYTKPGLYVKIPFIWKVNYFDKRIYTEPEYQAGVATKDGYFITLDTVFLWQISDAQLFIRAMSDSNEAKALLKNIVSGSVRQVISENNLLDTIRSKSFHDTPVSVLDGLSKQDHKLLGIDDKLGIGRAELSSLMTQQVNEYSQKFGVKVLAILLRNIKYEPSVEQFIYSRMVLERLREAAKLRSRGRSEAQRIKGEMHRKYQAIVAPATKNALAIMGAAEADATRIQAQAYGKNIDFYNYWRMLRVYKENLPTMSQGLILSTDNKLLQWLSKGKNELPADDAAGLTLNKEKIPPRPANDGVSSQ
jgi:membrane protease subunit HflC